MGIVVKGKQNKGDVFLYCFLLIINVNNYRKEMEYQAALREQIEEKKREKELEKRKIEDEKRRELDEFLATHQKKGPNKSQSTMQQNGKNGRKQQSDDEDDYQVNNDYRQNQSSKSGLKNNSKGFNLNLTTANRGRDLNNDDNENDGEDSARNYNKKYAGKGRNLDHDTSSVGNMDKRRSDPRRGE